MWTYFHGRDHERQVVGGHETVLVLGKSNEAQTDMQARVYAQVMLVVSRTQG